MASVLQPDNSLPSVRTTVQFTEDDGTTPVSIVREMGSGPDSRKGKYVDQEISIYDGRPIAKDLTLDGQGFVLTRFPTAVKDFYDDAEVRSVYYPEMEEIVRQATGCSKVVVFDYTIRVDDENAQADRKVRGRSRTCITISPAIPRRNGSAICCRRTKPRHGLTNALAPLMSGAP